MRKALSLSQQVARLREHGITVTDDDEAAKWLSKTNYYRVSGYWFTLRRDGGVIPGGGAARFPAIGFARVRFALAHRAALLRLALWSCPVESHHPADQYGPAPQPSENQRSPGIMQTPGASTLWLDFLHTANYTTEWRKTRSVNDCNGFCVML